MNLTNIYKGTKLYSIPGSTDTGQQSYAIPADFSGMAILYEYEPEAEAPPELMAFLNKVIEGGLKMDPAKVLTANLCHSGLTLQKLSEEAGAKMLIIFGMEWTNHLHNTQLKKNKTVRLYGMKVLVTDTLHVIQTDDASKKAFWGELKQLL